MPIDDETFFYLRDRHDMYKARCERLEQALREIVAFFDRDEYGASACGDVDHYGAGEMADIARKALEQTDAAS